MGRRRKFRRGTAMQRGKKIQVNFVPIVVIICLSIFAGYLTAKYVVYPFLGYEPAGLNLNQRASSKETTAPTESTAEQTKKGSSPVVEGQVNVESEKGYALQFGSYSTKAAAQKAVEDLKASGIESKVVEKDGAYKVVGQLFTTKAKAKEALGKLDKSVGAFITTIN